MDAGMARGAGKCHRLGYACVPIEGGQPAAVYPKTFRGLACACILGCRIVYGAEDNNWWSTCLENTIGLAR